MEGKISAKSYKHLASSDALSKYAHRLKYFNTLKRMLEAHTTQAKSLEFKKNLALFTQKLNYQMEIDRLQGELEGKENRLAPATFNVLEDRVKKLKYAIKNNLDDIEKVPKTI